MVFVVPFAFIVLTAVKDRAEAARLDFSWPTSWHVWENIAEVVTTRDYILVRAMRNSFILTVVSVALLVVFCSMAGFVLERRRDRMAKFVSAFVLAGLIIPPAVVPTIYVLQEIHLFNSLWGLVLVEVAYLAPFSIILFRAFVATIPRQLDEAAMIDGCSGLSLFFRVIFPLLRPVMITVIVTASVVIYNDFVNPLYFLPGLGQRHRAADALQLPEPVQHPVEPAVHGRAADHRPAADHVHVLQPQDRRRPDGRRRQGVTPTDDRQRRASARGVSRRRRSGSAYPARGCRGSSSRTNPGSSSRPTRSPSVDPDDESDVDRPRGRVG